MVELSQELCQFAARDGRIVVDTADAHHEAGDLLQAGLEMSLLPTLADVVRDSAWQNPHAHAGSPILFKSCGWAGWDLAAARLAFVG
jgi:ornithine cyclodeaminase